ncbi:hypothetical protein ABK040_015099 [Willaertia magna]
MDTNHLPYNFQLSSNNVPGIRNGINLINNYFEESSNNNGMNIGNTSPNRPPSSGRRFVYRNINSAPQNINTTPSGLSGYTPVINNNGLSSGKKNTVMPPPVGTMSRKNSTGAGLSKRPQSAATPRAILPIYNNSSSLNNNLNNNNNSTSNNPTILYFKYTNSILNNNNNNNFNNNNNDNPNSILIGGLMNNVVPLNTVAPNNATQSTGINSEERKMGKNMSTSKLNYLLNPNIPVVRDVDMKFKLQSARKQEESSNIVDRLNLDRKNLTKCPVIQGDTNLKLLNLQYNEIRQISNLTNLPNLVFLDLYNNKVRKISGLDALPSLRVLMLGKNQIEKIEGLEKLQRLDVLDLHGNRIKDICNLSMLKELRVLNLAGNLLTVVKNISGLVSLNELNLRKNEIERVEQVNDLPSLKRLFISSNNISNFDNITSVLLSKTIVELSLDDNPIFHTTQKYRIVVITCMPNLITLDTIKISEEEKESATKHLKRKDNVRSLLPFTELLFENVNDIREEIETSIDPIPPINGFNSINNNVESSITDLSEKGREECRVDLPTAKSINNPNVFTKIEADGMHIYGDPIISAPINYGGNTIYFHDLDIERVCQEYLFSKKLISTSISFVNNGLCSLKQLSLLGKVEFPVTKLALKDNPVCTNLKRILKPFCLYILPSLTELNGKAVSSLDRLNSEKIFGKRNAVCKYIPPPIPNSEQHSTVVNNYLNNVLHHTYCIDEKMKFVDDVWDEVVEEFIEKSLLGFSSLSLIK